MYRNWLSSLPLSMELFADTLPNKTAIEPLDVLQRNGIVALAERVIQLERKHNITALRGQLTKRPRWILTSFVKVIATIHPTILGSIIRGNVLSRYLRKGDTVHNDLLLTQMRGDTVPAIYANIFVDAAGVPPVAIHWLQWALDCEQYIKRGFEGDHMERWAESIDTVWYPLPYEHVVHDRRYCDTWQPADNNPDQRDWKYCRKRREKIWAFKNMVVKRAGAACENGRALQPMQSPLFNIGYYKTPLQRLKEHERHRGSNYIMNLTEALFMNRYNNSFRIHQLMLQTFWEAAQPWFGETAISQLIQGYVFNGTGFSHCQAGCSNISMFRSGSGEDEFWAQRSIGQKQNILDAIEKETEEESRRRDQAVIKAANNVEDMMVLRRFEESLDLGL
jgi:hypothetical protein